MKRFLKTISFVSLFSVPMFAFGEGPTDMANFSFRLKLQSRFSFTDSYRKNQLDIFATTARTGLNYKYKDVFGIIEFQGGSPSDALTLSTGTSTTNGTQELFIVRRAYAGLEIINSEMGTVGLLIGRDHNAASIVYAPDAFSQLVATNIDNMSAAYSQDGIALRYAGKFGFGTVNAQAGIYNNFPIAIVNGGGTSATSQTTPFGTSTKGVGDATFSTQSKSGSRAYAGQVGANVNVEDGVVEACAFYSMQGNAIVKIASGPIYTTSTISNFEGSLGYNYKKGMLRGGLWAQSVSYGKSKTSNTNPATNDLILTDGATDDSFTAQTFGIGVVGNSELFGLDNLLASGDKLTYGLGYQMVRGQIFTNSGGATGVTSFTNQKSNLSFYNVAVGYAQGAYTLELNYVGVNSDKAIYSGTDGELNKDTAYMAYLVGTIAL